RSQVGGRKAPVASRGSQVGGGKSSVASRRSQVGGRKSAARVELRLMTLTCDLRLETCDYGAPSGATRRFVACSNANASSSRRPSLHAIPVKLTPYGAGFALKPSGNAGVGALGIMPNGTMTVG